MQYLHRQISTNARHSYCQISGVSWDGSSERLSHTLRLVHVTLSKSEGSLDDLKVSEFRADGISATRPFEAHFKALGAHERAEGDIGQSPRAAINLPDSAAVRGLADNDQKIRI